MTWQPLISREGDVIIGGVVEGEVESREENRKREIQLRPGETKFSG